MTDDALIAQWDEQIGTARAALEQAFKIADAMADRIDAYAERERIATDARRKSEARAERLEAALRLLHDNVVLAFPTLADLGPVANARAALKGDDHE